MNISMYREAEEFKRRELKNLIVSIIAVGAIIACFFVVGSADYEDAVRIEQEAATNACRHAVWAASTSIGKVRAVRVDAGASTIYICNVAKVAS